MSKIIELCTEISEKIPQVSNVSYVKGYDEGYVDGYGEGRKDEYDAFWDEFFKSTDYTARFAGAGWTNENFRPTKDINITGNASNCFYNNRLDIDLVEWCEMLGISIEIKPTNVSNMFRYSKITRVPIIDVTNLVQLTSTFADSSIITIDKLILKDDGTNTFSSAFGSPLQNITIEGIIGKNIDIKNCKNLTKTSIESIMNARSETAAFTVTFSKEAVDNAFESSEGASDGSESAEWLALVNERPNVTISLV